MRALAPDFHQAASSDHLPIRQTAFLAAISLHTPSKLGKASLRAGINFIPSGPIPNSTPAAPPDSHSITLHCHSFALRPPRKLSCDSAHQRKLRYNKPLPLPLSRHHQKYHHHHHTTPHLFFSVHRLRSCFRLKSQQHILNRLLR